MRLALVFNPFSYKLHEENLKIVQRYFGLFPPLSLGWVVQDMNNPWNILAYSGGSAAGIWLGMMMEQRFIAGFVTVDVISPEKAHEIAEAVRAAGFGATEGQGQGAKGMVGTVRIVARRQELPMMLDAINSVEHDAFITTEETRSLRHGYLKRLH